MPTRGHIDRQTALRPSVAHSQLRRVVTSTAIDSHRALQFLSYNEAISSETSNCRSLVFSQHTCHRALQLHFALRPGDFAAGESPWSHLLAPNMLDAASTLFCKSLAKLHPQQVAEGALEANSRYLGVEPTMHAAVAEAHAGLGRDESARHGSVGVQSLTEAVGMSMPAAPTGNLAFTRERGLVRLSSPAPVPGSLRVMWLPRHRYCVTDRRADGQPGLHARPWARAPLPRLRLLRS